MTRVGGVGHGPSEVFPVAPEDRLRRDYGQSDHLSRERAAAGKDDRFGNEMRFGQFDLGAGPSDERETAFLDKVRRALGDARTGREEEGPEPRLLAIAGDPVVATIAHAGHLTGAAPGSAELTPTRAAEVAALADRIEKALNAANDGRQPTLSLRLDFSDGGAFTGMTITMSPTSIELVLARSGGEVTSDYLAAAQALADRLQSRFSRRTVRVLEVEAQAATPSPGLDEISRLLAHPGSRS